MFEECAELSAMVAMKEVVEALSRLSLKMKMRSLVAHLWLT